MQNDKSDYGLPRTKLHELLPEPYHSDVNKSLFENIFNRYLTKAETTPVSGTIGNYSSASIKEDSISKQLNQLEHIIYNKIGSVEHVNGWDDIVKELSSIGVDLDKFDEWGKTDVYGWMPPVDLDKLTNYRDYYWVGSTLPQYITVKNTSRVYADRLSVLDNASNGVYSHSIVDIQLADGSTTQYNKLLLSGDLSDLYTVGLIVDVVNSTNPDIANAKVSIVESSYDITTGNTTLVIDRMISSPIVTGSLSIQAIRDDLFLNSTTPSASGPIRQWIDSNRWVHRSQVDGESALIQANVPIIEFDDNIQLNNTIKLTHKWKYSNSGSSYVSSDISPSLIELTPIKYLIVNGSIIIDQKHGDLRSLFTKDSKFFVANKIIVVSENSTYESSNQVNNYSTRFTSDQISEMPTAGFLTPTVTSTGDSWISYDSHWQYDGFVEEYSDTQPLHPLKDLLVQTISYFGAYATAATPFSQRYTITGATTELTISPQASGNWEPLNQTTDITSSAITVLVNGEKIYFGFTLNETNGYLSSITFDDPLSVGDVVEVVVRSPVASDYGLSSVPVQLADGTSSVIDLTEYRVSGQHKSDTNQYPLFDLFSLDGKPFSSASHVFGYSESQEYDIEPNVGKRIDPFNFTQHLLDGDKTLAYRTVDNPTLYWVDENNTVRKWVNGCWSTNIAQGLVYAPATVQESIPTGSDGLVWYNPISDELNVYSSGFSRVDHVRSEHDPNLRTIWKKGKTQYEPRKVDIKQRTRSEYLAEQQTFVDNYAGTSDGLLAWYESQIDRFSTDGKWVGEWEFPEPLKYNTQHENRTTISLSQLTTHTRTLIENQESPSDLPSNKKQYHLMLPNDFDYGKGSIRDYGIGYDLLISSVIVNNVTVPTLLEFAHDQYIIAINNVQEMVREKLYDFSTSDNPDAIDNPASYLINEITSNFSLNDSSALIFGDGDNGVKNWVMTLPMLGIIKPTKPIIHIDSSLGINEILHHDGHRKNYEFDENVIFGIQRRAIAMAESVSTIAQPTLPAVDVTQLRAIFNDAATLGSLWLDTSTNKLYKLRASVDHDTPSNQSLYWVDLTDNTVKAYDGTQWVVTPDNPWALVDYNELLISVIHSFEDRLYEKAIEVSPKEFDSSGHRDLLPQFSDYVRQSEYVTAFKNLGYKKSDPFTWNYKRSTLGLGYAIASMQSPNIVTLEGIHSANFTTFPQTLYIKNSSVNDGKVSVLSATDDQANNQTILTVSENILPSLSGLAYSGTLPSNESTGSESAANWKALYQQFYNTPYPHLEPWCLQGFHSKPDWWDAEYMTTSGWSSAMWSNVLYGSIPAGKELPNGNISSGMFGELRQYEYVSVDLATNTLLPPYYDHVANGQPANTNSRSLFSNIRGVRSPASDFQFGDFGEIETEWFFGSNINYDRVKATYTQRPIEVLSSLYGLSYVNVDSVQFDLTTSQIPSRQRMSFHGDIVGDSVYVVNGIGQWYVNYNRYQGYDATLSDFRKMWSDWETRLSYRFTSFVNVDTFNIKHPNVDIGKSDYDIVLKKSSGVSDVWLDSFDVSVLGVPPYSSRGDDSNEWEFQINTASPVTRPIKLYGKKKYQFSVDLDGVCHINRFKIVGLDFFNESIRVAGDQTGTFLPDDPLFLTESANNNGSYIIQNSVYEFLSDTTVVSVDRPFPSIDSDGFVSTTNKKLPWQTGDSIWLTSDTQLPYPLLDRQDDIGVIQYFIVRLDDYSFRVASTRAAAVIDNPIDLIDIGAGNHYVAELNSSFKALGGARAKASWYHYAIDYDSIITIQPPYNIRGVQTVVDIIDGYSQYAQTNGFTFNDGQVDVDPQTGQPASWQIEIERFIHNIHTIQLNNVDDVNVRYAVSIDEVTNKWVWDDESPVISTGESVSVFSPNGIVPSPLTLGTQYYFINDGDGEFRLAYTQQRAFDGQAIDIIDVPPNTSLTLVRRSPERLVFPSFEINAFRNSIFFSPEYGIVSNLVTGPSEDVRTSQLIFDQYGRPIDSGYTRVLRQDNQTLITCEYGINNTVDPIVGNNPNPYNDIHFGGVHMFIDAYEHVLIFNNQNNAGQFVNDQFIGINTHGFAVDFERQTNITRRPTMGGSVLTSSEEGISLQSNFEAAIDTLRYAYDVFRSPENASITEHARKTIGYDQSNQVLDKLDLSKKSQYHFYRGMIQHKGTIDSIEAFTKLKGYIDVNVDEYWAYKVADFGSSEIPTYPTMYVNKSDITTNDIIFGAIKKSNDIVNPGYSVGGYGEFGYDIIDSSEIAQQSESIALSHLDEDRWVNHPDVMRDATTEEAYVSFDLVEKEIVTFNGLSDTIIKHNMSVDTVEIFAETVPSGTIDTVTVNQASNTVTMPTPCIGLSDHINVFVNGVPQTINEDYREVLRPDTPFVNELMFDVVLEIGDVVKIVFGVATLVDPLHIFQIDSNNSRLKKDGLVSADFTYTVVGYGVDHDTQMPMRMIDTKTNTTISDISYYDPARGIHNKRAIGVVDIIADDDPASYNVSNVFSVDPFNVDPWNMPEVGTVWMDTYEMAYKPYYNERYTKTLRNKIDLWGELQDWSKIKLYQWIESDVPPDEYNDLAFSEEGNSSIPADIRKSGRILESAYRQVGDQWVEEKTRNQQTIASDHTAVPNFARAYDIQLDAEKLALYDDEEKVSVYVNGALRRYSDDEVQFPVNSDNVVRVENLGEYDKIAIIKYRKNEEFIDDGVEDGSYRRVYKHTKIDYISDIGEVKSKYYFWVFGRNIPSFGKSMSITNAQAYLTNNPDPYVITSNVAQREVRAINTSDKVRSAKILVTSDDLEPSNNVVILTQDSSAYDGNGDNGSFVGGDANSFTGYSVGDIITLNNGMEVIVNTIMAAGDVVTFKIIDNGVVASAAPTTTVGQDSVVAADGSPSNGQGFSLTFGSANISTSRYSLTLTGVVKHGGYRGFLQQGARLASYYDGNFVGGTHVQGSGAAFSAGDTIIMSNQAEIRVISTVNGYVTEFDVLSVGDYVPPNTTLIQSNISTLSPAAGFGFSITVIDSELDPALFSASVNKTPIDAANIDIEENGRKFVFNQILGINEGDTIDLSYVTSAPTSTLELPIRHTVAVYRGIARYITDERRFAIQYKKNKSLGDSLNPKKLNNSMHDQWKMFREYQPSKIDRYLWDKVIESIVGETENGSVAPALDRVAYDIKYGTDTRFGFGDGQVFTDGESALNIIINDLENQSNYTVEQATAFFASYSFSDNESTKIALRNIYDNFATKDVNRIFFAILHDALVHKQQYEDIMKTSMIAVESIREAT